MFGNFNDTNSPRPLKSGRGELLILLFLHHKLAVFGVHGQLAVVHLSGHNGAGAQGFQLALDQALHRARAVDGIVALLHQQIDGRVGHSQLYLTLRQALAQMVKQQIDNAAHLIAAEGREDHGVVDTVEEFGLEGAEAHIINGHIPVEAKKGESPVKCNGKLLIIDGGFSKAYQPKTGIAGYTLIYNSYGLVLAAHEPFESVEKAVQDGSDIVSHTVLVQQVVRRKTVADTDIGKSLKESIHDLEELLAAYRAGTIVEKNRAE